MELRQIATAEVSALIERLTAAMEAEVEATRKQSQASADVALSETIAEVNHLTVALATARVSEQALMTTVDELRAESTTLRTALDESRADAQALQSALEQTRASEQALRSTIDTMKADQAKQRKRLDLAVQKVRDRCAKMQLELQQVSTAKAVADAQYEKDRLEWSEENRALRDADAAATAADIEYLRGAFQRLDAASNLADAVNELANSLAAVFPRLALFDLTGATLKARWRTGFDENSSQMIVPLNAGSVFHQVAESWQARQLSPDDLPESNRTLFGGSPHFVLIMPVVIEGTTAAVIYADDSGHTAPQVSPERAARCAEVLRMHAVPLLARLSAQDKLAGYESQLLHDFQIV
jgi:hypothetical protein